MTTYYLTIDGIKLEISNPKHHKIEFSLNGKNYNIDLEDRGKFQSYRIETSTSKRTGDMAPLSEYCVWCNDKRICVLPGKCKMTDCYGEFCHPGL